MTKQEVNEIITSKAAEYGFEIEENSMGWKRGAKFTAELQNMKLSYERTF